MVGYQNLSRGLYWRPQEGPGWVESGLPQIRFLQKLHLSVANEQSAAMPAFRRSHRPLLFTRCHMSTTQLPVLTATQFEPLLTSREAAPFMRIHYKTLESMARAGAVPATKQGKCWVFRLSRLSQWIDQQLDSTDGRANGRRD